VTGARHPPPPRSGFGRRRLASDQRHSVELPTLDYSTSCVPRMLDEPESRERAKAIVLVVDRDPHVRELASHFLHRAGYTVGFEEDGEGALTQARKIVPDIIITEILVPTLDGLALCRRLKADPRTHDIAVLVFSILAAPSRAREAGADAFLLKPLAEHTLVGTVQQLLEARSARIRRNQHER
jgi:CheY-like chemotaxis protein